MMVWLWLIKRKWGEINGRLKRRMHERKYGSEYIYRMPSRHVASLRLIYHVLFTQEIQLFIFDLRHLGFTKGSKMPELFINAQRSPAMFCLIQQI